MGIQFEQEAFDALRNEAVALMAEIHACHASGRPTNKVAILNLLIEKMRNCAVVADGTSSTIGVLA